MGGGHRFWGCKICFVSGPPPAGLKHLISSCLFLLAPHGERIPLGEQQIFVRPAWRPGSQAELGHGGGRLSTQTPNVTHGSFHGSGDDWYHVSKFSSFRNMQK
jgi:hypothetical protein